mgnify:CR=1 FL=1
MIVNNEVVKLDVAPFIENNRTMMQYNVLYVFGIDVQWVAETQSIVAEGNGLKVVMNLGSKVAVVNGEEVALDVAPYSVNGRTVVPVGFITGLLDITPVFTYNADGTPGKVPLSKPEDFASLIIWPWSGGVYGAACQPIFRIDNIRAVPVK